MCVCPCVHMCSLTNTHTHLTTQTGTVHTGPKGFLEMELFRLYDHMLNPQLAKVRLCVCMYHVCVLLRITHTDTDTHTIPSPTPLPSLYVCVRACLSL